jgi:hypothetical protein
LCLVIALVAIGAFFVVDDSCPYPEPSSLLSIYRNAQYGFEVAYPSGAAVQEFSGQPGIGAAWNPLVSVYVYDPDCGSVGDPARMYAEIYVFERERLPAAPTNTKECELWRTSVGSVGDRSAHLLEYGECRLLKEEDHGLWVTVDLAEERRLLFRTDLEDAVIHRSLVEKMLESFRFFEPQSE